MLKKIILVIVVLLAAMLINQVFSQPYKKEVEQFQLQDQQQQLKLSLASKSLLANWKYKLLSKK